MISQPSRSSGDLLADRRFGYAQGLRDAGDREGEASVIEQALERAPGWAAGWFALGEAREAAGDLAGAREAFARAVALAPGDPFGAGPRAARMAGEMPRDLPPAYVRALFDEYAGRFEGALLERLDYQAPALLRAAVDQLGARRAAQVLDLGCGTGLAGVTFADLAGHLVGVDLSPGMLEQARGKQLYAELHDAEVVAFLETCAERFDLIVAADVFVYLGALDGALAGAARVLSSGGLLAFTVERSEAGEIVLGDTLRYRHSAGYIERAVGEAGLALEVLEAPDLRLEKGVAVPGLVVVARAA